MGSALEANLKQRGRASIDFFASLTRGLEKARDAVTLEIEAIAPRPEELPDDLDERDALLTKALRKSAAYRAHELAGEWYNRYHGIYAREAFEEILPEIESELKALDEGPTVLVADPSLVPPDYWDGVNFHRTAGGWVGHPYQGFIHGEIVHRRMVDAFFPGGIFKQRRRVAAMAPKESYERILEMGSSTGHYTLALAETYPDAEITGVELSLQLLEHARRVGNNYRYSWKLYQRAAEATGFEANTFDLVTSYILLHELPADAIRAVFAEALRVLKPGGDIVMSDVTRYADLDKIGEWRADRLARYGGEPHWRSSASLDLGATALEVGFQDVTAESKGPGSYPFVVTGRKPA